MTFSVFSSLKTVHPAAVLFLALFLAAVHLAAAVGLLSALNRDASLDLAVGPPRARFWAVLSMALLTSAVWLALRPLLPADLFGARSWPAEGLSMLRHPLLTALAGAAAFWAASEEGGAGKFDRWLPASGAAGLRPALSGALAGAGAGLFGVAANRGLFVADALGKTGRTGWSATLLSAIPFLFAVSAAVAAFLALDRERPRLRRTLLAAALAALWIVPVELSGVYLRAVWDYGLPSLATAAEVPPAAKAPSVSVVILAGEKGEPESRYREVLLAAEGVDVSPAALARVLRYLEAKDYRTVFRAQALAALRRGWLLDWEPERRMKACMIRRGGSPPDYQGFLDAMLTAPATKENYERLEGMARPAWRARIGKVKDAQAVYEGFSAAYARYNELEKSNAWLERIQGLWPLFNDDIRIEPLAEVRDGRISGRLLFGGLPARGLKVGLFALPSTTTVIGASEALVASAYPDREGRFAFTDLLPGRYYLALQGDRLALGDERLTFRNAPGVIRLSYGRMSSELFPIEIERTRGRGRNSIIKKHKKKG